MIKATCHCGNIVITATMLLDSITSCNCSMCYRLGALWAYYKVDQVDIKVKSEANVYLWGSEIRAYHSCTRCGCTTHYTQKRDDRITKVAINTRMAASELFESANVRFFDGADTFKYIE